jgi:hypothetical protein
MGLNVKMYDGSGAKNSVKIDKENRMHVLDHGVPAFGLSTETKLYRDYFENSAGSNDMVVNGSVTNQKFYISAAQKEDRYISTISFVIADDGADLSLFGAIAALTNGVEFFYEDTEGKRIIHEGLKANWDFVRLAAGDPAFGTGVGSFKAPNVEGKVDAFIPVMDLKKTFGFTYGLRLSAGSSQRIVLNIRDDISAIDSFNAIAYGFDRISEG